MNYADAFKIGSKCDGYIKCTYAKLHSPDLGALFSLQAGYFRSNKARTDVNNYFGAETGRSNGSLFVNDLAKQNTDAYGYITVDIPIVKASEHIEIQKENDFVPVTLTNEAIQVIERLLSRKPRVTKYIVYKVWIADRGSMYAVNEEDRQVHHAGDRDVVLETYKSGDLAEWNKYSYKNSTYKYSSGKRGGKEVRKFNDEAVERGWYIEIEEQKVPNPQAVELIAAIREDHTFYVKACAIDWIPTNIDAYTRDQNGRMIKLADQLEAARKRLETAKAILATAATLTII